jgi:phosphoenolpyruvate-protein kinase (PTS system EI component)
MAVPDRSPSELAQTIHNNSAGFTLGPFTLQSKTQVYVRGNRIMWLVVVTRGARTWTGQYTTRLDGTLGKVYTITDEDGRKWSPGDINGAWADRGIG